MSLKLAITFLTTFSKSETGSSFPEGIFLRLIEKDSIGTKYLNRLPYRLLSFSYPYIYFIDHIHCLFWVIEHKLDCDNKILFRI